MTSLSGLGIEQVLRRGQISRGRMVV